MTAIGNCRSLKTIHLNPLGERGMYSVREVEATALLDGLKHNRALECLSSYWFNGFGTTEACIALAAVVRSSRSLDELDMRGIGLGVEGLGHISAALRDNSRSQLRGFYLNNNDIGDAAGAEHVAGILTHSPALRTLSLYDIVMDEVGAGLIADAVARSTTLEILYIGYDRLKSPEQAAMLIPVLTALSRGMSSPLESQSDSASAAALFNKSITQLWLEVTGPSGGEDRAEEVGLAEAVVGMVRSSTTLKFLKATSFFVTRGLWALSHNNSITELVLAHQHSLDDEELDPVLVAILQKCLKLQVLKLMFKKPYGRSKFTKEFFQGLKHNPCIKTLVLDGWGGLDDEMFEDLIQSLSTNTNLDHISIKGTSWEQQGKGQRLAKTLRDTRVKPELRALLAELESDRESPALQELPSHNLWGSFFDCDCQDGECSHRREWQWEVRLRLLTAIGNCRTLRKIQLNPQWRTGYSVRQVEALALLSGLQHNNVLQELNLCGYMGFGTTAAYLHALTAVIDRSSRSLHFLGLQYVGLSPERLGGIAAARRDGSSVLSRLCLCGNNIGDVVGAQHLADILRNSHRLRCLAISNISMQEEGSLLISEALAHTTTLTWLRIGDQEPRNAKRSAPMFVIPLLEALVWPDDFSRNPIKSRTLKTCWGHVRIMSSSGTSCGPQNPPPAFNRSITQLFVLCPGGQEAVEPGLGEALARVVGSNRALNELGLASFFVTRGLETLGENTSITKLAVFHSQHSDDDDMDPMLITILEGCKSVQELRLEFRKPFGPCRFTKAFFQGLHNNRSIKKLVLDGWDGLDDDMFHDLMRSLGSSSNNVLESISIKETSWESQGKAKHIQNALVQNRRTRRNAGQQGRDTAS